jgi:hypothetical protein
MFLDGGGLFFAFEFSFLFQLRFDDGLRFLPGPDCGFRFFPDQFDLDQVFVQVMEPVRFQ